VENKKLVLIGGGGHCKACVDVILSDESFHIEGVLDNTLVKGNKVLDFLVMGDDSLIEQLAKNKNYFLITVGQIKSAEARIRLYEQIKSKGGELATVVASSSIVSPICKISEGTVIMHHAVVNNSAIIGKNCIINNKALIEHDATIGDHCHISTGAIVNGNCFIGNRNFIGSGAVIVNNVRTTDDVVVGAGSVVHNSISEPGVYVGNPARKILSVNV
jgi:sugar O-acyltransferase (sialic acid O-acetyltransferase NeuD family)